MITDKSKENNSSNIFFIVGCPRSGKTLLQNIIGFHGDLAWFSQFNSRFPQHYRLGMYNRIYDIPFLGSLIQNFSGYRLLPHPVEFSKRHTNTLQKPGSLDSNDVTDKDRNIIKTAFLKQLYYQKKSNLITDCGKPARLLFYENIFPKTKFIHVIRDGRAVATECVFKYPYMFNKNVSLVDLFPSVKKEYQDIVESFRKDVVYPLVLASMFWKISLSEIETQSKLLTTDQYYNVRFEDLVDHPRQEVSNVLNYLKLSYTNSIDKKLRSFNFKSIYNHQQQYDSSTIEQISILMKNELTKYGYK